MCVTPNLCVVIYFRTTEYNPIFIEGNHYEKKVEIFAKTRY